MNAILTRIVEFLLLGSGGGGLRPGDPGVELGFARPLPAWGWLLVLIAAGLLAGWSYRRLAGSRPARVSLAVLRAGVLAVLVLVITGPQLVRPNDRIERDWVLVLVDRSASLAIPDAPGQDGRTTREAQLRAALERAGPMWTDLASNRDVVWMGFDRGAFDLRADAGGLADLGDADGRGTRLGAALDQALRRAAARPVSGVVIFSDGRSADEPDHATVRRLQADHIPVITIPLGSPEPVTDLAIETAEAPSMAFIHDTVPVQVRVERLGGGEAGAPENAPRADVELIDRATGVVMDRQPVSFAGDEAVVSLKARPDAPGQASWLVRLAPSGPDLIAANNQAALSVELMDRPLRVVYFDGYPRWEYRYIKNLLVRERSISSSSLLLAANRRSVQEGDVTLDAIPRSQEEWAKFDVVVLGDVRPEMFSREQLEQLREHVASRGGGLLWIGGPGATPLAWGQTPLADLLPFRLTDPQSGEVLVRAWPEPVTMARTELAARLGVLELADPGVPDARAADPGWPARLTDPATGWSLLRWSQHIDAGAIKPTAEVLATITPSSAPGGSAGAAPGVLSMRYGAGRVLYVATDETWRWRYARGESLQERFWLPLIRMQGRESLARSAKPATLEASPRRGLVEQPVRIALRLLDQTLVDQRLPAVTVRIAPSEADPDGPPPVQARLALEDEGSARSITQTYSTTWLPAEPGKYTATVIEPTLASLRLEAPIEVSFPDDELREPRTDHPLLVRLSQDTSGRVLEPDAVASLPGLLPKRDLRISGAPDIETLWDRPMVLVLILGLLTAEWMGRKLIQLS